MYVASFTDAWIETCRFLLTISCLMSHLLQMRGLKLIAEYARRKGLMSHLLQMRGLKQELFKNEKPGV